MNYPKITATQKVPCVDMAMENEDFSVDVSYERLKNRDYIVGINILTPQKVLRKERKKKLNNIFNE